ncbi:hypothetical protein OC844_007743 [Tilletia horrida]|nr:hypothetical protein OC844_007743 [Tilletia horrida]
MLGSSPASQLGALPAEPIIIEDVNVPSKKMAKRSDVWDDFIHLPAEEIVQCTDCKHKLSFICSAKTSASSMSRHLGSCKGKVRLESGHSTLHRFAFKMTADLKLRIHSLVESVLDHPDFRAIFETLPARYEAPTIRVITSKIGSDFELVKMGCRNTGLPATGVSENNPTKAGNSGWDAATLGNEVTYLE